MADKIKVLICEPCEPARVAEIENDLGAMQDVVGGYIQFFYPFDDDVCVVCNEEGKLYGMSPNRWLGDIIVGTFFLCGDAGDDVCSLTDEQIVRYEIKLNNSMLM